MKNRSLKYFLTIALLPLSIALMAQGDGEARMEGGSALMEWAYDNLLFLLGGTVVLFAFWGMAYLNRQLLQVQKIRLLQEHGIEVMEEVKLIDREPLWKQLYKRMTKAVPVKSEKDVMLDHNYDGIRELDNVLPPWWVAMFYITIFIGVVYFGYYHVFGYGLSSSEEYELAMERADDAVKAYLAKQPSQVDETNAEQITDATQLAMGETTFKTLCTPCHGQMGEGNSIGPNLTDEYWLNGGGIRNVFKTIKYGVPEKGMISWSSQLSATDMHRVASYIMTLQGTNPPNPKDPQGEIWKPDTDENVDSEESEPDSTAIIGMN